MERARIKERQAEGIALAKYKFVGRKLGSTISDAKVLEKHSNIVKKLNKGLTIREIAGIVDCSTTTVLKIKKILNKQNKVLSN
jgi:DNA invertase Pin-like site-specific DNA recombinase